MIDPQQLLEFVIRPVLHDLGLWSVPAEQLVLGTACKESECGRWLKQLGGGPALGIYQMEPETHDDIWNNYLDYHDNLANSIKQWANETSKRDFVEELAWNLGYATALCRVHYLRVPSPIPDYLLGQAQYWKQHYNTTRGKGTVNEYIASWEKFVPHDLW